MGLRDFEPTPIDPDSLADLSDEELAELHEKLEQLHLEEQRLDIVAFALNTEVPGTPSPYSENDRIKLLKRKEEMRRQKVSDTEYEDFEDVETEEADTEFYPQQLELAEHHQLMLEVMQALVEEEPIQGPLANGFDGRYADGAIFMLPPGSAKSSFMSVVTPSYVLGKYSGLDVMSLSYGADLARRFGRRVRHIVRQPRYERQFDTHITADNQAVDQWSLANGSTYKAAGILGGVTGNRADLALVDDPIAGREEAESDVIREKTWQALKDDVLTRLKPRGKIAISMTRWHEDDPVGRILGEDWDGRSGLCEGTDGRLWLVLCIPLIADADDDPLGRARGERLWPQWFDEKFVELARAQGERSWNSLYQQKPSASDGNILLKSQWRCWPHGKADMTDDQKAHPEKTQPPEFGKWRQCVLVYDTALEDDEDDDYSAMTAWVTFETTKKLPQRKMAEEKMQNILMTGAWRKKVQASELLGIVLAHIKQFQPDRVVIEKRASGIQLIQELRKRRPRHQYGEVIIEAWLPPGPVGAKGKKPRAHAASLSLNEGSVWYMPGAIQEAVIKECASFPNGRNDDWVDCVTCLTAGHLIALRRGLTPIEDVRIGDEALTPLGWRRVVECGPTGIKPVVERFGLVGTADHPIFTLDRGWANLGEVSDKLTVSRMTLCSLIQTILRRPWNTGVSHSASSGDIANTTSPASASLMGDRASKAFTSPYGRAPAGQFQQVMRCITKTAIRSTVALKTWSAYQSLRIAQCRGLFLSAVDSISTAFACLLPIGIDRPKVASGTDRTQFAQASFNEASRDPGLRHPRSRSLAIIAERHLSAPIFGSSHARASAMGASSEPKLSVVYNLQVDGVHCYYANGVLVHNCMISYARTTNLLEIAPDALSDDEIWEAEAEEVEAQAHPKGGYGNSRAKPYTQTARSLYGRSARA